MLIESLSSIKDLKEGYHSFYIYFSAPNCGVCNALHPQISKLMECNFPALRGFEVNTKSHPEIAAQLGFYTNPSIIIFLEGKEFLRRSRAISIKELHDTLQRPYDMIFSH